jgi:hypothetical protein
MIARRAAVDEPGSAAGELRAATDALRRARDATHDTIVRYKIGQAISLLTDATTRAVPSPTWPPRPAAHDPRDFSALPRRFVVSPARTPMRAATDEQHDAYIANGWTRHTPFTALPVHLEAQRERMSSYLEGMNHLKTRLLTLGGWGVCFIGFEEHLVALLRRGVVYSGLSRMMPGEPSRCHANAAACYIANRDRCSIATGYALSSDGIWRQHSWIVQPGMGRRQRVFETTTKRVRYYGVTLTADEAEAFVNENTW